MSGLRYYFSSMDIVEMHRLGLRPKWQADLAFLLPYLAMALVVMGGVV